MFMEIIITVKMARLVLHPTSLLVAGCPLVSTEQAVTLLLAEKP
jgi:hypothetical protein